MGDTQSAAAEGKASPEHHSGLLCAAIEAARLRKIQPSSLFGVSLCLYDIQALSLPTYVYIYIYLILILHVVYLTESIAIVSPRKGVQHGNRQRPIPLEDVGIAGSGGCFA